MTEKDSSTKGYFPIPNMVVDEYMKLVGPDAFTVYVALRRHSNRKTGTCYPSYDRLIAETGIKSRATISKCVAKLQKHGLVKWETKKSNVYTVVHDVNCRTGEQFTRCTAGSSGGELKQELENKNKTPAARMDDRFPIFKEKLIRFHRYMTDRELVWDGGQAKQLNEFLRQNPGVDLETFHQSLVNYKESENIIRSKTPKQFLPNLNLYFDGPLNKYGKPVVD